MPSLIDLRRRIRAVKNTEQITKAMKMVAASKLRRAQERIMNARPYAQQMHRVLTSVASRVDPSIHPLLIERERRAESRTLVIVVTGDKGLCGSFNTNAIKAVAQAAVSSEKVDRVVLVYNEFKSVMTQRLVVDQLLPITRADVEASGAQGQVDYLYEPSPQEIFNQLLPRYVEVQVYRALLESNAAFFAAQMTAMDTATKNSREMISNLTLYMNKVRQAAITREIIEVVSGAQAL